MRTILAILLSIFLISTAQAARTMPEDTDPGIIAGEQVHEMPQDMHAWYLSIFTSAQKTADERRLESWFGSNDRLKRLAGSTHFQTITPANTFWQRYWEGMTDSDGKVHPPLIGSLPAVTLQKPNGDGSYSVVARFQAPSIYFSDSDTLAKAIAACVRANESVNSETFAGAGHILARPWNPNKRPCPDCGPKPTPAPLPGPNVDPFVRPLVPDVGPEPVDERDEQEIEEGREEEVADETSFMLVLLCVALPAGLFVAVVGGILGWATFKPNHRFYKHR